MMGHTLSQEINMIIKLKIKLELDITYLILKEDLFGRCILIIELF